MYVVRTARDAACVTSWESPRVVVPGRAPGSGSRSRSSATAAPAPARGPASRSLVVVVCRRVFFCVAFGRLGGGGSGDQSEPTVDFCDERVHCERLRIPHHTRTHTHKHHTSVNVAACYLKKKKNLFFFFSIFLRRVFAEFYKNRCLFVFFFLCFYFVRSFFRLAVLQ